jgi:hypothetical protein
MKQMFVQTLIPAGTVDLAGNFESAVSFEFEESDLESESCLPAKTDGILNCGCEFPSGSSLPSVRISFVDADGDPADAGPGGESDVLVDLRTGKGVGEALAALFSRCEEALRSLFRTVIGTCI